MGPKLGPAFGFMGPKLPLCLQNNPYLDFPLCLRQTFESCCSVEVEVRKVKPSSNFAQHAFNLIKSGGTSLVEPFLDILYVFVFFRLFLSSRGVKALLSRFCGTG